MQFLAFSDSEWARWPAGPYLIELAGARDVIGSTGISYHDSTVASTGYVLAKDVWGRGFATEALRAIVETADELGITKLQALCHPENGASLRVLEKCGFGRERKNVISIFPNLDADQPQGCFSYVRQGKGLRDESDLADSE
jgi:RimJ/RimL family protein N-acetyltransferase